MKAVYDAGQEISKNGIDESEGFIFPSYVEILWDQCYLIMVMDPLDGYV